MKKLAYILLILFILNQFAYGAGLKEEWEKVKALFTKGKNWLVERGLWDPLVKALKEGGKTLGKTVCKNKFPDYASICTDVVNWIFNHLPN